eukprot:9702962-Alexandrium_andersonii.AAC.1
MAFLSWPPPEACEPLASAWARTPLMPAIRSLLLALPLTREASWSCRSDELAAPAATFCALLWVRSAD